MEAQSLVGLARIAVAAGRYEDAVSHARQAIDIAKPLGEGRLETDIRNQLALALLYQGEYEGALSQWKICLQLDRANGDAEGQAIWLSNIGGIYDYQGRYSEALRSYQTALDLTEAHKDSPWAQGRRQIAQVNLATLFQRIGQMERALDLYLGVLAEGVELPPSERARMLGNIGALYRHLGDPVKALGVYGEAQELYRSQQHSRGEISVLNNRGLAEGFDLGRIKEALATFVKVEQLARETGDRRKAIRAQLHLAELHSRLGRMTEALDGFQAVVQQARELGTPDEQWRGLYGLARLAEASQDLDTAEGFYEQALGQIESVRTLLDSPSLRTEFMSDKDDVYDGVIELHVRQSAANEADQPTAAEFDRILRLVQQQQGRLLYEQFHRRLLGRQGDSESETFRRLSEIRSEMADLWRKRLESDGGETSGIDKDLAKREEEFRKAEAEYYADRGDSPPSSAGLAEIQSALPAETILLTVWIGREWCSVLWITAEEWGVDRSPGADKLLGTADKLRESLNRNSSSDWRPLADELGDLLLGGIPSIKERTVRHAVIVSDPALQGIPFEVLGVSSGAGPDSEQRLVEVAAVSYLPSSAMAAAPRNPRPSWWLPFTTFVVALADSLGDEVSDAPQGETGLPALPYARQEVATIARLLSGRVRIYEGALAGKEALMQGIAKAPAVIHLATHAVADLRDSDYSRILLAPPRPEENADYLFLAEISSLDLRGLELVTLSACETERGRLSGGGGSPGFR